MSVVMDGKEQGNLCYRSGQFQQACELYRRALEEAPSAALYLNLALCLFHLEQFEDCVKTCEFALAIDKEYMKARYRRALALERLGRFLEAAEDFRIVKASCTLTEATEGLHRCLALLRNSATLTQTCHTLTAKLAAEDFTAVLELAKTLTALHALDSKTATQTTLQVLVSLDGRKAFEHTAHMLDLLTKSGVEWQGAEDREISALCRAAQRPSQALVSIPLLCCLYDKASITQENAVTTVLCNLLSSQYQLPAIRGIHTVLSHSQLPAPCLHSLLRRHYSDNCPELSSESRCILVQCLKTHTSLLADVAAGLSSPNQVAIWGLSVASPKALLGILPVEEVVRGMQSRLWAATDLKTETKANLLLQTLKNLLSSQEYRTASASIAEFLQQYTTLLSANATTEACYQALLALLQSLNPQTSPACSLPRVLQLLPSQSEPALDALCLLACQPACKMKIVVALQSTSYEVTEAMLFPVTVLLRNLALSSLDKALISVPSHYSESETEQLRELMQLSGTASPSAGTESEDQSAVAKRLLSTSSLLPKVLAAVTKTRKALSPSLLRVYLELVFGLAEIKETRALLVSHGALDLLLKSSHKGLAGHAVARLLLSTAPNLVAAAVLHDCVGLIQGALSTSTHQLIDLECALALVNLSGYHADFRDQMISIGTHRTTLDLIASEQALVSKTGLELLCNLCASDHLHTELSTKQDSDLVQVLTALLDSTDEPIAYLAVSGLANLAPIHPSLSTATKSTLQSLSTQHTADDWTARLTAILSSLI